MSNRLPTLLLALPLVAAAGCQQNAAPKPQAGPAAADEPARAPSAGLTDPNAAKETAPATFKAKFSTSKGDFTVLVHRDWAPLGADRFYNLVKVGFFDEARFFRVVPNFMVQFGLNADPSITRVWKDARIQDDPVKQSNKRGYVTFAAAGPNSRTTQVFVNFGDNARLDGMGFAPFGEVIEGMAAVDGINAEYRERPNQGAITSQGNAYLTAQFPNLDFVKRAKLLP